MNGAIAKERTKAEGSQTVTDCHRLKLVAGDGAEVTDGNPNSGSRLRGKGEQLTGIWWKTHHPRIFGKYFNILFYPIIESGKSVCAMKWKEARTKSANPPSRRMDGFLSSHPNRVWVQ